MSYSVSCLIIRVYFYAFICTSYWPCYIHPLGENRTTSWESPLISIIKMVDMSTKLLEMECKYWIFIIMELYCTVKTYSSTCTLRNRHTSQQKIP